VFAHRLRYRTRRRTQTPTTKCSATEHTTEHMEQVSVRMPESMRDRLEEEAEDREMGLAEYIRHQLREGDEIGERVDELEQRLVRLEEASEAAEKPFRVDAPDRSEQEAGGAGRERARAEAEGDREGTGEEERAPAADQARGGRSRDRGGDPEDLPESIEEALEGWPPHGQERRERRHEVGAQAAQWLRDRGEPASGSDFKEALFEDLPVPGQNPKTWWVKSVRPAVQECVDAGLVEYREGYHDYRWTGSSA